LDCVAAAIEVGLGGGASNPRRRSSAGKSSLAPVRFWSSATKGGSFTGRCAGGSASIDSDRPCAFFLADLSCPVSKYLAIWARRHRPVLAPMEPAAFEYAQAFKKLKANREKAS
jgi:hypothetical protein